MGTGSSKIKNGKTSAIKKLEALHEKAKGTDLGRYVGPDGEKSISPLILPSKEEQGDVKKIQRRITNKYGLDFADDDTIAKEQTVDVSSLRTIQPYVERGATMNYINQMSTSADIVPKSNLGMGDVVVIRYNSKNYVIDGNHRMAAAKLLGRKKAKVTVVDADAIGIKK